MSAKIAEFTPMASASVITATMVNPGDLISCRNAKRKSWIIRLAFPLRCRRPGLWIQQCGTGFDFWSTMSYARPMPELSRFYGIIIRMFSEPSERHHMPHFHAYYGEHVAVFSISPVALIIGFIPQRQQRLVEAWAELHEEALLAAWHLLGQGRKPSP